MKQSPSSGGMTTQNTIATVDSHDNAHKATPVFAWGWPDEARLAAFAGMGAQAEGDDWKEQVDRMFEDNPEYATLHFVS